MRAQRLTAGQKFQHRSTGRRIDYARSDKSQRHDTKFYYLSSAGFGCQILSFLLFHAGKWWKIRGPRALQRLWPFQRFWSIYVLNAKYMDMLSAISNLSYVAIILRVQWIKLGTLERAISNLRKFWDIRYRLTMIIKIIDLTIISTK